MKLSELTEGEKASIVKVGGHGGFRKRIIEMGFVKGKVVQSLQEAPLNDPVIYKVMGYEVSLRKSEAALVEVIGEDEVRKTLQVENPSETIIEEEVRKLALKKRKEITVALVGNPNCGKTTLFNIASGSKEHVGNYGGVTVDAKGGHFTQDGYRFRIVDLPGTYSISAYSPEEKYVRDYLSKESPDVVINVIDASNLERNLYLTTQLIDMHQQTIVALNMFDELQKSGDNLDYKHLGKMLGMPFIPIIAKTGFGVIHLFRSIIKMYESTHIVDEDGILIQSLRDDTLLDEYHHHVEIEHKHAVKKTPLDLIKETNGNGAVQSRHIHINYGASLEPSIRRLRDLLVEENHHLQSRYSFRYLSIKLLENESDIVRLIRKEPNADKILKVKDEEVTLLTKILNTDIETAFSDAKYGFIAGALKKTFKENGNKTKNTLTSKLDSILIGKFWGYPIFIFFMYLMFQATFSLGAYPMNWIESGVSWLSELISGTMAPGPLKDLLVDGVLGGVGGVIVFLPNILILYFFISLMEDTGYMARAAFIMDKFMNKIGLHGKSFIPLIMGFGCNVPAIMATRTIENRNSRIVTILINPLMSCSARLPVYLLLAGTFFPKNAGLVLFGVYSAGIILSIFIALIFKKFIFRKDEVPFVMELPPYRMPTGKAIWRHTWNKGAQYLRKMGTIILVGSIVIWFLGYYPRPHTGDLATTEERTEQLENSYIGKIGHAIEPVIKPLGFDWKIGISLLSGIAAKEIVVSTLGVIYSGNAEEDTATLSEKLKVTTWSDGSPVYTPAVALGLMLFVLIYFPCLATFVAIKNETGSWRCAVFALSYSLVLAWFVAFLVRIITV
ncbi:MAG: ferrous iron transport protein B [Paludibacteraceae bacterium]